MRAVLDTSECLAALKPFPALTLSLSTRHFTGALFSPQLDDDEAETSRLGGALSKMVPIVSLDRAGLPFWNPSLDVLHFRASGCSKVTATSSLGCDGTALSSEQKYDALSLEHSGERKPAFAFPVSLTTFGTRCLLLGSVNLSGGTFGAREPNSSIVGEQRLIRSCIYAAALASCPSLPTEAGMSEIIDCFWAVSRLGERKQYVLSTSLTMRR